MKKFMKWLGFVLGGFLVLLFGVLIFFNIKTNSRLNKSYDPSVDHIIVPTDSESIARGEHWVMAECKLCHGSDLSGGPFFQAPIGYIDAVNLTSGEGGIGGEFTDQDWVRAIRYGVDPNGHSLLVMPAPAFWYFNDQDLADIIAYLKTLPPVDRQTREPNINLLGKALLGAGLIGKGVIVAEDVPSLPQPDNVPVGITPQYGNYLVNVSGCRDCHGQDLSGGKSADPAAKPAPNLTPGGELIAWQEADFINTLRTGTTPFGLKLDPAEMPWEDFKNFFDDELGAIFAYLSSLPKLETSLP